MIRIDEFDRGVVRKPQNISFFSCPSSATERPFIKLFCVQDSALSILILPKMHCWHVTRCLTPMSACKKKNPFTSPEQCPGHSGLIRVTNLKPRNKCTKERGRLHRGTWQFADTTLHHSNPRWGSAVVLAITCKKAVPTYCLVYL